MLLDTTFFIDLQRELKTARPGACASFLRNHRHETKHVSVVTIGEFAVQATAAATERFFKGYAPIALGRSLAIVGGRLQAHLDFELGENDLWIAASALSRRFPVVTRDRAFGRVPGLRVVAY